MRATYPDHEGFIDNDGVKIAYEVYGSGSRAVVFTPTDPIVHSRAWKAQIPFLARTHRVVAIDPRGNGRSDRPAGADRYRDVVLAEDTLRVMDDCHVGRAVLVGLCSSSWPSFLVAARHPDRVSGVVSIATWTAHLTPPHPTRAAFPFHDVLDTDEGWAKDNKHYWMRDYDGFMRFFFNELLPEPHSTKQVEDCVAWGHETTPEVLIDAEAAALSVSSHDEVAAVLRSIQCPVLTVHGDDDRCQPWQRSAIAAELSGGRFVRLEGAGHLPQARHPVVVNHLIRDFLDEVEPLPPEERPPTTWRTAASRPPRALFLSSPIGLGHARRDLAIAQQLRALRPDLEIDWFTQHPVTELLDRSGERVHPAAALLANESAHFESECGEHDLHAFQALRRMDEILVANFMLYDEIARTERYDLVVGDEAWDVDHFLHENPELKANAFAWLTDFVGWLPFADGGEHEAALTRDYNAEMVEHVARYPRLRDLSLFVGDPEDLVPQGLGEGLPTIRDWTADHFDFCGYITGFDPVPEADVAGMREELGYQPDEHVCLVTVGGSGAGLDLLRRVVGAFPAIRERVPALRMVVVTGPRIDPGGLGVSEQPGLELHAYVHELWRHLAVCDVAVVQGGLTTTMELVANRRPFVYVPLEHHFEQQFHVAHRLDRYRAGIRMDYAGLGPDRLGEAIAQALDRPTDYLPVSSDGAARAAGRLAELF